MTQATTAYPPIIWCGVEPWPRWFPPVNIYRTKIKLRAAANQAIYLVIFYRVVGSLCLNWYIYTNIGFLREWSGHSRYMPVNLF